MTASDSIWLSFFTTMAFIGAIVVIVGVALEGTELLIKLAENLKARRWIVEIFGRSKRRAIVLSARYVKPRLLIFEGAGFLVLVIGLAIELLGSFGAERMQSKQNTHLRKLAADANERSKQLESTNFLLRIELDKLEKEFREATSPRVFVDQGGAASRLSKFAGSKVAVISTKSDDETVNCAGQIRMTLFGAHWKVDGTEHMPGIQVGGTGGSLVVDNPSNISPGGFIMNPRDGVHVLVDFRNFEEASAGLELVAELLKTHISSKADWGSLPAPFAPFRRPDGTIVFPPSRMADRIIVLVGPKPNPISQGFWNSDEPDQLRQIEKWRRMGPLPKNWTNAIPVKPPR